MILLIEVLKNLTIEYSLPECAYIVGTLRFLRPVESNGNMPAHPPKKNKILSDMSGLITNKTLKNEHQAGNAFPSPYFYSIFELLS